MEVKRDISQPLEIPREGEAAITLSASEMDFWRRKIEAFSNIQADPPLKIVKSDAMFKIVVE